MASAAEDILDPFVIEFSDLLLLSSYAGACPPASSPAELARLDSVASAVIQNLGPSGPGLISVSGVPRYAELRQALLPLARDLALLGHSDRTRVLKEHGLGSDVPLKNLDRTVSSFAMQLKYGEDISSRSSSFDDLLNTVKTHHDAEKHPPSISSEDSSKCKFDELGNRFNELGLCMVELGLRLAQICDKIIGCNELEQSIMKSGSAKGRLIHYHSIVDNRTLKKTNKKMVRPKQKVGPTKLLSSCSERSTISRNLLLETGNRSLLEQSQKGQMEEKSKCGQHTFFYDLWQQWHYDYGIFTILTSPLFLLSCLQEDCPHSSCHQECPSPNAHTYLQLYDTKRNKILIVRSPPDNFIIQVGEAADILSGGQLQSTLHSVGRPADMENLSRETFVVFLQPPWNKVLTYSNSEGSSNSETYGQRNLRMSKDTFVPFTKDSTGLNFDKVDDQDYNALLQEVLRKIPPLFARFKEGMTFAEFSRETTKQYYGGSGTQSLR